MAFLHHQLVPNTSSSAVELDPVELSKVLNLLVLLKVFLGLILDVVVKGHDDLLRVLNLRRSDGHKLQGHGP